MNEVILETEESIEIVDSKKNIFIIGEVNENISNEIIQEIINDNWDKEILKTINIYINSPGGFLSDCFAIIDLVMEIKKKYNLEINTFGLGEVTSAGFFLFLLGDNRILYPSCRVYVHSHLTLNSADKTYDERIKADKTEEKEIYDNYISYVSERLEITQTKAKNLLKKNKWLNKKEIKEYNITKVSI